MIWYILSDLRLALSRSPLLVQVGFFSVLGAITYGLISSAIIAPRMDRGAKLRLIIGGVLWLLASCLILPPL